jgi:uncharacterized protein
VYATQVQANSDDIAAVLGLFAGIAQQQAVSEANKEWQNFPEPDRSCLVEGLLASGNPLDAVIQAGIGPRDPQLSELTQHCQSFKNIEVKQNYACEVQVDARTFTSWCDDGLVRVEPNGDFIPVLPEDAITYAFQNAQLQIQQAERQDAKLRRNEMIKKAPELSVVPPPNFDCAKADSRSEKTVCASFTLSTLDTEFGALYKRAQTLIAKDDVAATATAEYERTEYCNGDAVCIRRSKETAIDEVATLMRLEGQSITTSVDLARQAEEEKKREEKARIAAQREKARKEAEERKRKEEEAAILAAAKAEAERQKAEDVRLTIEKIVTDYTLDSPRDLVILENQSATAPNLAKSLSGEIASATGIVVICTYADSFGLSDDPLRRYEDFLSNRIAEIIPSATQVDKSTLTKCKSGTVPDYYVFQPAFLTSRDLPTAIEQISGAASVGFVFKAKILESEVRMIEKEHDENMRKKEEERLKAAEDIEADIKAGSRTGGGVLFTGELTGALCYVTGDRLGETTSLSDAIAGIVLEDLAAAEPQRSDAIKRSSPKSLESLDKIFFSLQKTQGDCGMVLASAERLSQLVEAMDRDGIAYSVPAFWIELTSAPGLYARAQSLASKLAAEKALADQKAAEEAASKTCERNWRYCADNADVANNYSGMSRLEVKCKMAVDRLAKFGDPDWGGWLSMPFSTFIRGDSAKNSGTITLIDNEVQLQNGFGAYGRAKPVCVVDLETEEIISLEVSD